MKGRRKEFSNSDRRLDETDHRGTSDLFEEYGLSRTVFAFAGMGALMGLLVGGTTMGFPIAISSTIVGGIGGGILGKYVKTDF